MKEVEKIVGRVTEKNDIKSFNAVYMRGRVSKVKYWMLGIFIGLLLILLLPWTQNIRARGSITTLRQEHRPQEVNAIIPGRIVKWHVREGDFVKAGDTLVQLAEIKDDYLDPQLLERTSDQLTAKEDAVDFYTNKVSAAESQLAAMKSALTLKLEQLRLKVVSDSIEAKAAENGLEIAEEQYRRQRIMRDSGFGFESTVGTT